LARVEHWEIPSLRGRDAQGKTIACGVTGGAGPKPAAVAVALKAIQLHGGNGYVEELHIVKLARDAKLLELGAGHPH
jgi:alkylation response protein AidB-like acyl-CoA dehydrogenase